MAISGLGEDDARVWMEMAGGDLNQAIQLLFGSSEQQSSVSEPTLESTVWFSSPVPDSWMQQGLDIDTEVNGIPQPLNGPCGILAAFHGAMLASSMSRGEDLLLSRACVISTLDLVIRQCSTGGTVVLAQWQEDIGGAVDEVIIEADKLKEEIDARYSSFGGPGGAVLLVYSLVLTRGLSQIAQDMVVDGGPPLVMGPNWFCSFSLISLVLRGIASGNIGAFDRIDSSKPNDWEHTLGVGVISQVYESEVGMPICDTLKSPRFPVWVVHGGDHFTTLWCPDKELDDSAGSKFTLLHYNGLPPGGPKTSSIVIESSQGPAESAPETLNKTFFKPVVGSIEGVVMANSEDKLNFPGQFKLWNYEIVLVFDDPSVQGEDRPPTMASPPIFQQGSPVAGQDWRCTRCYSTRFKTMCFGMNSCESVECQHCGLSRTECGWSIWVHYDELPGSWKSYASRLYGPKINSALRSKWPGCQIEYGALPPSI